MEALGGGFWAILAISWALLGDLGVKLGASWQDVVRKLAEDGGDAQNGGKMAELGGKRGPR